MHHHGSHLAIKRSQSECLILGPKIFSPSPIVKKASRIGANVARELFDIPPKIEEFDFEIEETSLPRFFKAKSCIFQDSSNEWSSESGFSGCGGSGEIESPQRKFSRNPLSQDSLAEEISVDMPARASNPIINDSKFRRNDKPAFAGGFPFESLETIDRLRTNL